VPLGSDFGRAISAPRAAPDVATADTVDGFGAAGASAVPAGPDIGATAERAGAVVTAGVREGPADVTAGTAPWDGSPGLPEPPVGVDAGREVTGLPEAASAAGAAERDGSAGLGTGDDCWAGVVASPA